MERDFGLNRRLTRSLVWVQASMEERKWVRKKDVPYGKRENCEVDFLRWDVQHRFQVEDTLDNGLTGRV